MTQAIGLASALVILAYLLVLYALLTVSIRRFLEDDAQAARGPLVIFGVLVLAAFVSISTWASSALGNAISSVEWMVGSVKDLIAGTPISLVCIGPLIFVIIFTLATPGARRWIGSHYLLVSWLILGASFISGIVYLTWQTLGGLGILALVVLIGLVVGLGARGLVFIPELNDGPRLGESGPSSAARIAVIRARRSFHAVSRFVSSLVPRTFSRQGVPVVGLIFVIAFAGWWYAGRSEAEPENGVSVVLLSSPTITPQIATLAQQSTATPTITRLRVVNTGGQGLLMRDQPARSAKPVASLPEGTTLEIAGPEQTADGITWRQVKEKGGKVGWVATQYLEVEQAYSIVKVANTGGIGVNLRAQPSKTAKIVVLLKEGAELKVIGEDTSAEGITWRNVKDDNGNVGWVSSEYLVPGDN